MVGDWHRYIFQPDVPEVTKQVFREVLRILNSTFIIGNDCLRFMREVYLDLKNTVPMARQA